MSNEQTEIIINDNIKITDRKTYLCVIMPAFNEGECIKNNILEASRILSSFIDSYQIIVVNDGSSDNTRDEIMSVSNEDKHIGVISYKQNKGKGSAIAKGVYFADAEYIAFLDSDLELNPIMLRSFLNALLASDSDIAIGSKLHKESKLIYPMKRKIMSFGYYIMLKVLFNLKIKDTQTGIKLFKSNVIKPICANLLTTGFAFDIEILATASKLGYTIIEMPIELEYKRDRKEKSRFSAKTIFKVFKDTLSIRKSINSNVKLIKKTL